MNRLSRLALVFGLLTGCDGGPVDDPADAGGLAPLVVDVTQRGRVHVDADGETVDAVELAVEAPPFDLPAPHPERWGLAYFEHDRYECARDGQQTVLLLNPPGMSWEQPADLLVYLHGGGLGAFDEAGAYHPEELSQRDCRSMVDQEDPERLLARWYDGPCDAAWPPTTGLAARLVEDADLRVALVSKCDQDVYSGDGRLDARNRWNPDNRVDGLLATRAAIELAYERGWIDDARALLLAGASAGGVGVHTVARRLEADGRRVAGVVSDAAVMNNAAFERIRAEAPEGCAFFEQVAAPADFRARVGPEIAPENEPHLTIGPDTYPVFQVYAPEDSTFCSPAAVEQVFRPTLDAIARENPGGVSETRAVCVDGDCDAHAFIRAAPRDAVNTSSEGGGERILEVLHRWLRARRGLE